MIYGSGSYAEIPWDTLIKLYQKEVSENKIRHVQDCADSFEMFLNKDHVLTRQARSAMIANFAFSIIEEIAKACSDLKQSQFSRKISDIVDAESNEFANMPQAEGVSVGSLASFRRHFSELIFNTAKIIFSDYGLTLPKRVRGKINEMVFFALNSTYRSDSFSGIFFLVLEEMKLCLF